MRRRRKVNTRWLDGFTIPQGAQTLTPVAGASVGTNYVGINTGPVFTLLTTRDVTDQLDGNGTILRIVGNIRLFNNVQNTESQKQDAFVWEGIKVVDREGTGPTYATFDLSTVDSTDASWMWTRTTYLNASTALTSLDTMANNEYIIPFGSYVDVRSKRRIRKQQALEYYLSFGVPYLGPGTLDVNSTITILPTLRILAKLNV